MPSREQKRAERRKRKARSAERIQSGYAKAEERNRVAREELEPLGEEERPQVVTVAAVLSAAIAILTMGGWLAGVEVDGERPEFVQALAPAFLFGVMAWGMWKARYWAVLGFQTLLVFVLFGSAWGLATEAGSALQVIFTLGLLAVAGSLFYLMVKAMARIQMPNRHPPR